MCSSASRVYPSDLLLCCVLRFRQTYCALGKFVAFRSDLLRPSKLLRFEQICCFVVSCVFVKFIALWANLWHFGQICCARQNCCVSGRFIAPVRFVAFRADLLRFAHICCTRQISCFFASPPKFLALSSEYCKR